MLGAFVAYRLGVPLAASWHTNVHEYGARRLSKVLGGMPGAGLIASQAEKRALDLTIRFYKLARLLFAPNPELIALLSSRTGQTVYSMDRGIDCELFAPSKRATGERPFTIGYVGRLSAEKNVRVFAEIEQALQAAGMANYRFLIVGDGSERAWLRDNLQRADLPGLMHGQELSASYANMDVFVFPSETDTYGNVVQEAMASGVPCLVSARGGPQFLVAPEKTGFVARDTAAYAEGILRLASDRETHRQMSQAAREWALKRSWSAVFASVYSTYRMALLTGNLVKPGRAAPPTVLRPA
jgi:glycosyltransferase involved in cell wall biosynthesis